MASALLALRGAKGKEEIKPCAEVPLLSLTLSLAASHPSPRAKGSDHAVPSPTFGH